MSAAGLEAVRRMMLAEGRKIIDHAIAEAVAAERERIRQLATEHHALYLAPGDDNELTGYLPFADLLGPEVTR